MPDNVLSAVLLISIVTLWILLPVIPAVLIYALFPKTEVGLGGPLQGLTLKAGGAFAAYFATLLATLLGWNQVIPNVQSISKSYWTLDATLHIFDEDGKRIAIPQTGVTVSLEPKSVIVSNDNVTAFVPRSSDGWPKIKVDVDKFGSSTFALDEGKIAFSLDQVRHRIVVNEPLIIRRPPTLSYGAVPTDAAVGAMPTDAGGVGPNLSAPQLPSSQTTTPATNPPPLPNSQMKDSGTP